ncbi:hypothetical protein J6590_037710 [Homalodisca vitripennis]|nr:hypothetical protein J6590_037710 [Homalodisca vitripennis]
MVEESPTTQAPHFNSVPCDFCVAVACKIQCGNIASPPYSPILAPLDLFLFPQMKRKLKGHQFDSIKAVQEAMTKVLNSILETNFLRAFDERCPIIYANERRVHSYIYDKNYSGASSAWSQLRSFLPHYHLLTLTAPSRLLKHEDLLSHQLTATCWL